MIIAVWIDPVEGKAMAINARFRELLPARPGAPAPRVMRSAHVPFLAPAMVRPKLDA